MIPIEVTFKKMFLSPPNPPKGVRIPTQTTQTTQTIFLFNSRNCCFKFRLVHPNFKDFTVDLIFDALDALGTLGALIFCDLDFKTTTNVTMTIINKTG